MDLFEMHGFLHLLRFYDYFSMEVGSARLNSGWFES
jgi:hypothetical protein